MHLTNSGISGWAMDTLDGKTCFDGTRMTFELSTALWHLWLDIETYSMATHSLKTHMTFELGNALCLPVQLLLEILRCLLC